MLEEREYEGYWWLPEEFDERVGGELTFSQEDGIHLRLFSALDQEKHKRVAFDNIFGLATSGEKITLKDTIRCGYSDSHMYGAQIMSTEYKSDHLYVGELFEEEPVFDSLKFEFPLLFEWMDKSGITTDEIKDEDPEGFGRTRIEHELPGSYSTDLEEFQIKLHSHANHKTKTGLKSIEEDAYFLIDLIESEDEGFSFEEAKEFTHQLQSFVTFAMSEEVHPKDVVGQIKLSGMPPVKEVDVLYPTGGDPNNPQSIDPNTENFLLTDIEDRFSDVMGTWFERYDELKPVFSLFFSTRYNSSMYVENEFLSLTRGIESYHRMGDEGAYLEPDDFNEYYEYLVDDIPEDFDQSFKDHLREGTFKYANGYSLRKRLELLGEEHQDVLEVLPIDFSEYVNPIKNARNNLTHRETGEAPDVDDLLYYITILEALVEIILLKELDIPQRQIMENIDIHYEESLKEF
ncbi:HEPN domain-containing protein [Saliphagus sp. LR7]|uniref:ApeA N-terminal domain 1-containing protein n=1 Tax=Saliphagus sp. LR7 TaxID=2282654 RepID=UPI000DF8588D|nr:HEPN domain-containing protein [Saliphagus sp. LR7]